MKRRMTVMEYAYRHGGLRKAQRGVLFFVAWVVGEHDRGAPFANVEDYAAYWGQSNATSYREQQAFRACFPECSTPGELLALLDWTPPARVTREAALVQVVGLSL